MISLKSKSLIYSNMTRNQNTYAKQNKTKKNGTSLTNKYADAILVPKFTGPNEV